MKQEAFLEPCRTKLQKREFPIKKYFIQCETWAQTGIRSLFIVGKLQDLLRLGKKHAAGLRWKDMLYENVMHWHNTHQELEKLVQYSFPLLGRQKTSLESQIKEFLLTARIECELIMNWHAEWSLNIYPRLKNTSITM